MIQKGIMNADTLLANPNIIRLDSFASEADTIVVVVHSRQKQPLCPSCNQPSASLHIGSTLARRNGQDPT